MLNRLIFACKHCFNRPTPKYPEPILGSSSLVVLLAYFPCQESNLYCPCCHCRDSAMKNEYRLYFQKKDIRVYHTFQNEPV